MTLNPQSRTAAPLAVMAGGAVGALVRLLAGLSATASAWSVPLHPAVPVLAVNVLGSWAIGVVAARWPRPPAWLTTGVLGGFTTFSGWVLDVARLWPDRPVAAVLLGVGTPALTVLGCALGLRMGEGR